MLYFYCVVRWSVVQAWGVGELGVGVGGGEGCRKLHGLMSSKPGKFNVTL